MDTEVLPKSNEIKIFIPDDFQQSAKQIMEDGFHLLLSAPTGCGKTFVAETAIEIAKNKNKNATIILTEPTKAVCNQKYANMSDKYSHLYSVGLMTGDNNINSDAEIIIMTTEVLYNKIINSVNQEEVEDDTKEKFNPACIIFDEAHYINDEGRGHVWEKSIIFGLNNLDAKLVLLSATIGNLDSLLEWLNSINKDKIFKKVVKTERPVPLREWVIDSTELRNFSKKPKTDEERENRDLNYKILPLNEANYNKYIKYCEKLEQFGYSENYELNELCKQIEIEPSLGLPAIVFALSKKKCFEYANMINVDYSTHEEKAKILKFYDDNLKEYQKCSQYIEMRKVVSKGIGYHHSGLIPKIREVIELLINVKLLKIVFATETFAVGLNFPVKTVVITGLNKPTTNGFRNLLVSEYKQMAGRAGRRSIDPYGNVIFWLYSSSTSKRPDRYLNWISLNNIINGKMDSIESKFIIEPNYIIKNIANNILNYREVSDKSFKYYKMIKDKRQEIIVPDKFKSLYEIEKKIIEFGKMGITYNDKNYKKIFQKMSQLDKDEYKNFLKSVNVTSVLSEYEIYVNSEDKILEFLKNYNFIDDSNSITDKGRLCSLFNEINSIVFVNDFDIIFKDSTKILPILSMFIDDGNNPEDQVINYEQSEINYFKDAYESTYKKYSSCPRWNFYPNNYLIMDEWLSNTSITLDEISNMFNVELGMVVKILIKMYQVSQELIDNLGKLNKPDLSDYLNEQKSNLIRDPLKIESLYTQQIFIK